MKSISLIILALILNIGQFAFALESVEKGFLSLQAQPNFVNDPTNAEMLLITHEALLTDEWEPGMNGAWETTFLSVKSSQG